MNGEKNKMKNFKSKTIAISIAIILTISMAASIILIPSASAHSPPWQIPTYAYIVAAPNPIGVGQPTHVYMWLDPVFGAAGGSVAVIGTNGSTASAALIANNYRFHNYNLTITAPDGTSTTQIFATISDPTSSQYIKFTPDKIGTYTLTFNYPGEAYGANGNGYEKSSIYNDTYLPSSATATLTVQQEPIPDAITSYPLPTAYWTHPIYGENTDWWTVSSNWLGSGAPAYSTPVGPGQQMYHPDGVGSLTSHVMWTRPLQFGGVVGGQFGMSSVQTAVLDPNNVGVGYFEGSAYEQRFTNPIIVDGFLYYKEPRAYTGPNVGPLDCVNLQTGQLVWSRNDIPTLSFAYIYNLWDQDEHGTFLPILFTSNFAQGFDAYTGDPMFNVTNVPSGTSAAGPEGEQIRYVMTNTAATGQPPTWYLAQWNSSKLWQYDVNPYLASGSNPPGIVNASNGLLVIGQVGTTFPLPITGGSGVLPNGTTIAIPYGSSFLVNANVPINGLSPAVNGYQINSAQYPSLTTYDWNISVPFANTMPSVSSPFGPAAPFTIVSASYGDMMLCRNGSLPLGFASTNTGVPQTPYTFFAVNLNASKGAVGSVLWSKTYDPPAGNISLTNGQVDFQDGVFTITDPETMQWRGYSLHDGSLLWTTPPQNAFDYYGNPSVTTLPGSIAYGKLYSSSFSGVLYCYDITTGQLLWTYGNGGPGNSTNSGFATTYGDYPTFINAIGNGVVYLVATEHTITDPIYKGALHRAVNATTGQEIWTISAYTGEFGTISYAMADGYNVWFNGYDNQIYTVGRGPSATTVQAPMADIQEGSGLVIKGTVIDVSAGTKQDQQAADFPNGVPVASDASMKDWMGYVYQQKPLPSSFTGVDVTINVLDSNGNYRSIGTATTDATGSYSLQWKPDIPGKYTVFASFAGTNSYWPSSSETSFAVDPAPPAHATPTPAPQSASDMYFVPAVAGLFVAIFVVGALLALLLLRKHP